MTLNLAVNTSQLSFGITNPLSSILLVYAMLAGPRNEFYRLVILFPSVYILCIHQCGMTLLPGLLNTNAQPNSNPSAMPRLVCVAFSLGKGPLIIFLVGHIAVIQESRAWP